jgi:hypothetical protein
MTVGPTGRDFVSDLRYIGPAELHDGSVRSVKEIQFGGVRVAVRAEEHDYHFDFYGRVVVNAQRTVGMKLSGVAASEAPGSGHRIEFVNRDEGDDASLEVSAQALEIHASTMTPQLGEAVLRLLNERATLPTDVHLADGRIARVRNVAWGRDRQDEYDHVTTDISPPQPSSSLEEVDLFFTYEVVQLVDPSTNQVLFNVWAE